MSLNLQYNYAAIDLTTYECYGCLTKSYEVIIEAFIPVPVHTNDYIGKYYNMNGDQMWYLDAAFTQLWDDAPTW